MLPTDCPKTSAAFSATELRLLAADASTSATAPTTPTLRTYRHCGTLIGACRSPQESGWPQAQGAGQRRCDEVGLERAGELVVDVPVGMLEPVEGATCALARLAERAPVELHVGVVLEEDVHRLVCRALELLPCEHRAVALRERLEVVADHEAKVLEP